MYEEVYGGIHLIAKPLHLVHDIQATVHDEGVHLAGFGGEAGNAVAALFGGAEFKLEEGFVLGVDYGEVVRHCERRNFLIVGLLESLSEGLEGF